MDKNDIVKRLSELGFFQLTADDIAPWRSDNQKPGDWVINRYLGKFSLEEKESDAVMRARVKEGWELIKML